MEIINESGNSALALPTSNPHFPLDIPAGFA